MNMQALTRETIMAAQLADAERLLACAAENLTAAAMSITGVLIEGECRESAKLQALAGMIATHKHMVSGLAELLRQAPKPHLQPCAETGCARPCPYDPA